MGEYLESETIESASASTAPTHSGPFIYIIFAALSALIIWASLQTGACSAAAAGWMYDNLDWSEMAEVRERILEEINRAQQGYSDTGRLDEISLYVG